MKRLLFLLLLLTGAAYATVPAVPYSVTYTCTGGFGPFAFTFPISDPTALTVNLNGVQLASTSYTVMSVNNNYNNGGKVTLGGAFPCTSGYTLILTRVTPITQTINFYDNMPSLPMITGRSVDKLTEISQELEGLIGQIAGGSGVTSIQMQNAGVNFGTPMTGLGILNFANCTVTGTSPSFTITCSGGGGGVTSVTGTANQIDVANGTTTPVISLDGNIILPGNISMTAPNAANFGSATSFKVPTYPLATASAAGFVSYDTTAKSTHFQTNNADSIAAAFAAAPAGSKCLHTNGTTGLVTETSGDCASLPGGTGIIRVNSGTPAVAELSGDVTTSGSNATTLATVNSNVGSFTGANITVNAKGLITAAANGAAAAPPFNAITSGTNTTAAMVVGAGASLDYTSTGTIDANKVNGGTVPASAFALATNSSKQPITATRSGNTSTIGTTSGTLTSGDCVKFDASGNLVDSGAVCPTSGTGTITIASGTSTMGTSSIGSGACASAVTTSASGVATTDSIIATPNTDPSAVTGYAPSASGSLFIYAYPTANNVNFKVCNNTAGSITPSALTMNWRVVR